MSAAISITTTFVFIVDVLIARRTTVFIVVTAFATTIFLLVTALFLLVTALFLFATFAVTVMTHFIYIKIFR